MFNDGTNSQQFSLHQAEDSRYCGLSVESQVLVDVIDILDIISLVENSRFQEAVFRSKYVSCSRQHNVSKREGYMRLVSVPTHERLNVKGLYRFKMLHSIIETIYSNGVLSTCCFGNWFRNVIRVSNGFP